MLRLSGMGVSHMDKQFERFTNLQVRAPGMNTSRVYPCAIAWHACAIAGCAAGHTSSYWPGS